MRFVVFDATRKNGPQKFFHWKVCIFFKNFGFQQPLRCYRKGLKTSTLVVKIRCGPLKIALWDFSHSILREKNRPKSLLHWKFSLFFQKFSFSLTCWVLLDRNDLVTSLVVVKIPFEPWLFVLWGLSHTIIWEKMPNSFLHWKDCISF